MEKPNETALQAQSNPAELLKIAVSQGADVEKLERLMELQVRWDSLQAKKAFNKAMMAVQKNIPTVAKELSNPQTRSKYAGLDTIIQKVKPVYTSRGFSIVFSEGKAEIDGQVRIIATVRHMEGHQEDYHYDVPMDGTGIRGNQNMTAIHAKASSTAYARRYLMCMIWNIPTGDDDDGNKAGSKLISDAQVNTIRDIGDNLKDLQNRTADQRRADFLRFMNVNTVEEITLADYPKAIKALKAAQGAK